MAHTPHGDLRHHFCCRTCSGMLARPIKPVGGAAGRAAQDRTFEGARARRRWRLCSRKTAPAAPCELLQGAEPLSRQRACPTEQRRVAHVSTALAAHVATASCIRLLLRPSWRLHAPQAASPVPLDTCAELAMTCLRLLMRHRARRRPQHCLKAVGKKGGNEMEVVADCNQEMSWVQVAVVAGDRSKRSSAGLGEAPLLYAGLFKIRQLLLLPVGFNVRGRMLAALQAAVRRGAMGVAGRCRRCVGLPCLDSSSKGAIFVNHSNPHHHLKMGGEGHSNCWLRSRTASRLRDTRSHCQAGMLATSHRRDTGSQPLTVGRSSSRMYSSSGST